MLGLSPDDEARIMHTILPALSRGVPTQAATRAIVETTRRFGRRLTTPVMGDVRFAFVKNRPR